MTHRYSDQRIPGNRLLHSPGPTHVPEAVQNALRRQPMDLGDPRLDETIAACEAAPTCTAIGHEDDCLGRPTDCSAVYTGNNCKKTDGSACHAGDTGCTCESFTFASCQSHLANTKVFENGTDATQVINQSFAAH